MQASYVTVSLRDENHLDCSYAIVRKVNSAVVIVVRDSDCAIFDFSALQSGNGHYLLLKHYSTDSIAYCDFLKLIGKMCTKREDRQVFRATFGRRQLDDCRRIRQGTYDSRRRTLRLYSPSNRVDYLRPRTCCMLSIRRLPRLFFCAQRRNGYEVLTKLANEEASLLPLRGNRQAG